MVVQLTSKYPLVDKDSPMLPAGMTQNNVFVGSTSDLQRKLLDKMKVIDGDSKE